VLKLEKISTPPFHMADYKVNYCMLLGWYRGAGSAETGEDLHPTLHMADYKVNYCTYVIRLVSWSGQC
jgi:hypothetical protein